MNGALKGTLTVLAILIIIVMSAVIYYKVETGGTFRKNETVTVEIESGSSASTIANALENNGVIGSKYIFRFYIMDKDYVFQYGNFEFNPHSSYDEIIELLCTQQVVKETATLTIPEGTETKDIVAMLVDIGIGTEEEIVNTINTYPFEFDWIADLPTENVKYRLEGYLFPDTYEIYTDDTPEAVIAKLLSNFEGKTANLREEVEMNGGNFHDTVIMASIVEREGKKESELPIVSSVFYNRLAIDMKLESCATVQYIMQERKEVLTYEDTAIDNPYNTYVYAGLPPSPIANPGLNALRAAVYPDDTEYLYFVARYDGSSYFATTYAEHQANIIKSSKEEAAQESSSGSN